MSRQIAVRLPDELVDFFDEQVVTVAPITTAVRGLSTEVPVDAANGLDGRSAVSCDNIATIPAGALRQQIGVLLGRQEPELSRAIQAAFDLE